MCTTRCKTIGSQVPSRFPRKPILSFSSFIRAASLSLTQMLRTQFSTTTPGTLILYTEGGFSVPRNLGPSNCIQKTKEFPRNSTVQDSSEDLQFRDSPMDSHASNGSERSGVPIRGSKLCSYDCSIEKYRMYSLVQSLCDIAFFRYYEFALSPLSQKRTKHRIQHAEVPWHIDEYLKPETTKEL